jgi:hypothetical protein
LTELLREVRRGQGTRDEDIDEETLLAGSGSKTGLAGVQKLRKKVYQSPELVIEQYVDHMKRQLGVTDDRQFWKVRDWSLRQSGRFGRMRFQLKAYVMVGDILDHCLHGRHAIATALLVQCQKSFLQYALDGGSWDNAQLLWPESDPFYQVEFGGLETEMAQVHMYRKAINDLKAKVKGSSTGEAATGDGEEEPTPQATGGKGGKNRRRNQGEGGAAKP